ncbi:MAG: hypothetical protein AAF211_18365, partial [Myxococcota bacterium]
MSPTGTPAPATPTGETGEPELCPDEIIAAPGTTTGNLLGLPDRYEPSCSGSDSGPDLTFELVPPVTGRYRIDTRSTPFDTVLTVLDDCQGGEVACNDNAPFEVATGASELTLDLVGGEPYVLVVDTARESTVVGDGTVTVNVAQGVAEVCDDGVDNDLDGRADCDDRACATDGGCCPVKSVPGVGTYTTSLFGLPDVYDFPSCAGNFRRSSSDVSFAFTAPETGLFQFSSRMS